MPAIAAAETANGAVERTSVSVSNLTTAYYTIFARLYCAWTAVAVPAISSTVSTRVKKRFMMR